MGDQLADGGEGEAEAEGAKAVEGDSDIVLAADLEDLALEAMELTGEHLDLVTWTGNGVKIFNRALGQVENLTQLANLLVGDSCKGPEACLRKAQRGIHHITTQE